MNDDWPARRRVRFDESSVKRDPFITDLLTPGSLIMRQRRPLAVREADITAVSALRRKRRPKQMASATEAARQKRLRRLRSHQQQQQKQQKQWKTDR